MMVMMMMLGDFLVMAVVMMVALLSVDGDFDEVYDDDVGVFYEHGVVYVGDIVVC